MSKKSQTMKRRLGKKLKQSRRLPILTALRTHRRVQRNIFSRDWRHKKIRLKGLK
jgi:ribosomal protein L39E